MEKYNLFTMEEAQRSAPVKRMHVVDAGSDFGHVHMICNHCGYNDGWSMRLETLSELKRGIACPQCNK